MQTRYFALIFGIVYLLAGILGFIPGISPQHTGGPDLAVDASYRDLFGLFPVNALHNLVHILVGLAGIVAYRTFSASRSYAIALAAIFALLTLLGLIDAGRLNTLFGLVPLFSHDIWLHALTTLVAAYFGFVAPAEERGREAV